MLKECLIPIRKIIINNNFTSIKYAITKLYEAWFDDKPQAFRIAHKMIKEDTFAAVYIQPAVLKDNIFSVITRSPVDGNILKSDNYQNIVHCKLPFFDELISSMLNVIDGVFNMHQNDYSMTKKAHLSILVEKHRKKHISSKEFLQFIMPDDLVKFNGYVLDVPSIYKQAKGLSSGVAGGYVIFTAAICRGKMIPAIEDGRFSIDRMNKVAYALGNVIQEVGFFQGKYGRNKVILLCEKGVDLFSDISGIMRIDFEANHFEAAYDSIRRELEFVN